MTSVKQILDDARACDELRSWVAAAERNSGAEFSSFAELWRSITDPDWLTWLMRRCPEQFALAWSRESINLMLTIQRMCVDQVRILARPGLRLRICDVIRQHVELRREPS